jgi:hypothetical protein
VPGGIEKLQEKEADTTYNVVFREAKARLFWIGSFTVQVAVTFGTIFGMIWVLAVSIEDHWYDESHQKRSTPRRYLGCLIAASTAAFAGIYILLFWLIGLTSFREITWPPLWDSGFNLAVRDQLMDFVFPLLLPSGITLIKTADVFIFIAVILIAGAVTATAYEHPCQAEVRVSVRRDLPYERLLTRCFQRLTVCIYFGAILLAACIAQVGARYLWLGSLLTSGEQAKKDLSQAFIELGTQFQVEFGLIFSLILAALFVPAWIVLRRRAWQVVRAELPEASLAEQDKWLTERKMAFTGYQQFGQWVAILAPAGVAGTSTIVNLFGH